MIYKAMIEQWDEAAADKSATDDWERDAKGGTSLDRGAFTDSLFELADTWAYEVDPDEYASLLWELFSCLTYGEPCEQAKWKELHEISYLGEWKGEKKGYGRFAGPPDPDGARAKAAAEEKAAAEARLAAEAEAEMRARMEAEEWARAEREAAAAAAAREAAAREAAAKEAAAGEMEVRARIYTLPSCTTTSAMTTTGPPPPPALFRTHPPSSPPLTLSSLPTLSPTATPGQGQGQDGAAGKCRQCRQEACRKKGQARCKARTCARGNRCHEGKTSKAGAPPTTRTGAQACAHRVRMHIVHTSCTHARRPAGPCTRPHARIGMHTSRPARDLTRPCPLCSPAQLRLIRAVASAPRKAAARLLTSSKLAPASPVRGARPPSPHLGWTQPDLEWTQPHIRILHSYPDPGATLDPTPLHLGAEEPLDGYPPLPSRAQSRRGGRAHPRTTP
jgi:translation initiation factor IF-2